MTAYVSVGGTWLGGWCWQEVARRLRDAGHDAYPATLTGLGERVHLASPEVDLDTHITDMVNLIEIASGHPLFTEVSGPEWRFVDLPTGHWPILHRDSRMGDGRPDLAPLRPLLVLQPSRQRPHPPRLAKGHPPPRPPHPLATADPVVWLNAKVAAKKERASALRRVPVRGSQGSSSQEISRAIAVTETGRTPNL
jgi:hypothetical protein